MKKLFIFTGLMAVLFMAAVYNVEAQKSKPRVRILTGTIKSYECGDNCYLTIADARGKEHTGLCSAGTCNPWNEKAAMPRSFKGRRVTVTVGKGKQYDGAGTVMGTMDSYTKIAFLKPPR